MVKKLSTIVKHLEAFDELKSDGTFTSDAISFDDRTAAIVTPATLFGGRVPHGMTDWALHQVCGRLGPPPYKYMKDCPTDLRATNLNHWIHLQPRDKQWFLRFAGDDCRAVLSERYSPIMNTDIAKGLLEILGDGYELVRPYYDGDTIHLKFRTMSDPDDDNFGYGVYVGNGEVGNRALTVAGFIQRNSCANSIVITDEKWRKTHIGIIKAEALVMVKLWVGQAMQLAVDQREKIAEAAMEQVEDFSSVVEALCKKKGLNEEVQDNILMGSEGAKTLFGLVNGLSYAAHQQDDPELQIDLEVLAGNVLMGRTRVRAPALSVWSYERQQEEEEV